jgi:hypothetical protein
MSKKFLTDVIAQAADMPASAAGRLAGEIVAAIKAEIVETRRFPRRSTLLRRSPAWVASDRVRRGRAPSTMPGHLSCRSFSGGSMSSLPIGRSPSGPGRRGWRWLLAT